MERKFLVRVCLAAVVLFTLSVLLFPSVPSLRSSNSSSSATQDDVQVLGQPGAEKSFEPLETPRQEIVPAAIQEQEHSLEGVRHYTRRNHNVDPGILFLVLTKDAHSWGYNEGQPRRKFENFLSLLASTGLDLEDVSLGLLTSSKEQYHHFGNATQNTRLASTSIFLHPGYADEETNREDRHDLSVQTRRRAEIAKLRNYLMLRCLRGEAHIIWLDADVYDFSNPQIVSTMLEHATDPDVGMITTRCEVGDVTDYDKNAWFGTASRPELARAPKGACVDTAPEKTRLVGDLIKGTSSDDLIRLDAVGASLLYMRASLVHQGLSFPHSPVVGTTWMSAGWDGIESEGLCYRARGMKGGTCWVLGGDWFVKHTGR